MKSVLEASDLIHSASVAATEKGRAFPSNVHAWLSLIAKWKANRRVRRHLATLPDHLLEDIGLTRQQAEQETQKWFWQD